MRQQENLIMQQFGSEEKCRIRGLENRQNLTLDSNSRPPNILI